MEIPGFQESAFRTLHEPQQKVSRTTFNRKAALQNAPDHIKPIYEDLFRQIDTIELLINYYEIQEGKRKNPPRESLQARFTEEELQDIKARAINMEQYRYLKLRHLLVELRSQQYSYYETYCNRVIPHGESINNVTFENEISIGEDIEVLPLGLWYDNDISQKIFGGAAPDQYTEEELQRISSKFWKESNKPALDFRNEAHIFALYQAKGDLIEDAARDPNNIYGTANLILKTLQFYEDQANLSPLQKEILDLKLRKTSNIMIADYVNKKYGKTYNDNYISTIFHRKIIRSIAAAAQLHEKTMQNIFYPENFKVCRDCGRTLLLTSENFVKQKKSSDGFAPRCKRCEKIKRSKYR